MHEYHLRTMYVNPLKNEGLYIRNEIETGKADYKVKKEAGEWEPIGEEPASQHLGLMIEGQVGLELCLHYKLV